MEIPFVGPTFSLESRPSGVQRTVGLVPVPQEPGNERTAWTFKDVPGLVEAVDDWPDVTVITVMALFHFTEEPGEEGTAEFFSALGAQDQTGAEWTTPDPTWELYTAAPAPKFGGFAFGPANGLNVTTTWTTTAAAFDRLNNEPFAIDGWFFAAEGSSSVSNDTSLQAAGNVGFALIGVNSTGFYGSISNGTDSEVFSGRPVGASEAGPSLYGLWTHLRLSYDGITARLFINGSLWDSAAIDMSAETEWNFLNIAINVVDAADDITYVDEAYWITGTALSTSAFTPPTEPWPNPS